MTKAIHQPLTADYVGFRGPRTRDTGKTRRGELKRSLAVK
jgi:hypothetical protein